MDVLLLIIAFIICYVLLLISIFVICYKFSEQQISSVRDGESDVFKPGYDAGFAAGKFWERWTRRQ